MTAITPLCRFCGGPINQQGAASKGYHRRCCRTYRDIPLARLLRLGERGLPKAMRGESPTVVLTEDDIARNVEKWKSGFVKFRPKEITLGLELIRRSSPTP